MVVVKIFLVFFTTFLPEYIRSRALYSVGSPKGGTIESALIESIETATILLLPRHGIADLYTLYSIFTGVPVCRYSFISLPNLRDAENLKSPSNGSTVSLRLFYGIKLHSYVFINEP